MDNMALMIPKPKSKLRMRQDKKKKYAIDDCLTYFNYMKKNLEMRQVRAASIYLSNKARDSKRVADYKNEYDRIDKLITLPRVGTRNIEYLERKRAEIAQLINDA